MGRPKGVKYKKKIPKNPHPYEGPEPISIPKKIKLDHVTYSLKNYSKTIEELAYDYTSESKVLSRIELIDLMEYFKTKPIKDLLDFFHLMGSTGWKNLISPNLTDEIKKIGVNGRVDELMKVYDNFPIANQEARELVYRKFGSASTKFIMELDD